MLQEFDPQFHPFHIPTHAGRPTSELTEGIVLYLGLRNRRYRRWIATSIRVYHYGKLYTLMADTAKRTISHTSPVGPEVLSYWNQSNFNFKSLEIISPTWSKVVRWCLRQPLVRVNTHNRLSHQFLLGTITLTGPASTFALCLILPAISWKQRDVI